MNVCILSRSSEMWCLSLDNLIAPNKASGFLSIGFCWAGQNVHLDFSIICNRKTRVNFGVNLIKWAKMLRHVLKYPLVLSQNFLLFSCPGIVLDVEPSLFFWSFWTWVIITSTGLWDPLLNLYMFSSPFFLISPNRHSVPQGIQYSFSHAGDMKPGFMSSIMPSFVRTQTAHQPLCEVD